NLTHKTVLELVLVKNHCPVLQTLVLVPVAVVFTILVEDFKVVLEAMVVVVVIDQSVKFVVELAILHIIAIFALIQIYLLSLDLLHSKLVAKLLHLQFMWLL
ncbi:hypothetical protein PanWU01x14_198350, partial [Parasponia andersonii]